MEHKGDYCIFVDGLRKAYHKNHYAVDGISFKVEYGTVFGFLGPNGAGKTTTINVLTTVVPHTQGEVFILAEILRIIPLYVRRKIGVVLQEPSFETNLTVERSLHIYGMLRGLSSLERINKTTDILKEFDLLDIKDKRSDELSIGQRRRVQVAREFMHDMDLLFLDEPTIGIDTYSRRRVLDYIKEKVKKGLTVFFTTHNMEEAEYLCNKIAVINHGKIVAIDTPTSLRNRDRNVKDIEIKFKSSIEYSTFEVLKSIVDKDDHNNTLSNNPEQYSIRINSINPQKLILKIMQGFAEKDEFPIESIAINPPTLEDAYLSLLEDDNANK